MTMHSESLILIVDDDPQLRQGIEVVLESAGYATAAVADGQEALKYLNLQPVSLIVSDIAMPQMNGYQLLERVRRNPAWEKVPFIFLTARGMDSDVRYGKELGVDDYLVKPFESQDLIASVRGKLRWARQEVAEDGRIGTRSDPAESELGGVYRLGRLKIAAAEHRAWIGDEQIKLSPRELRLLEHLARNAGRVVSAQELVMSSHDLKTDNVEAGNLVRPLIRSLRRKLGYSVGEMGCIENVRGAGYRLHPLIE